MNVGLYAPLLFNHFHGIFERHMKGMPVVNEAIRVESRAWREHEGNSVCVMITPWFMSLMLFPPEEERFSVGWKTGETHRHAFPSGVYEFTAAWDEEIGFYQSCSLFSPVFEFDSHPLASEVADHAMAALFEPGEIDEDQKRAREIPGRWAGESTENDAEDTPDEAADTVATTPSATATPVEETPAPTMSRRDLFRAALRRDRE